MTNHQKASHIDVKIDAVAKAAGVSKEVARRYLEAEGWLVCEAIYDIRAERKAGLL